MKQSRTFLLKRSCIFPPGPCRAFKRNEGNRVMPEQVVFKERTIKRFWSLTDKRGPDDCWEYKKKNHKGYGGFRCAEMPSINSAHRFSMCLHLNRELPSNEWVLHDCDNPPCVNPNHLYIGDHDDNMRDKVARNRCSSGENHGKAILKNTQVIEIAKLYQTGEWTYTELAEHFGVCYGEPFRT
jgi:hypothetical protein